MSSPRWQPIAPASLRSKSKRTQPADRSRRGTNQVACIPCREKRTKCDSDRPKCSRCETLGLVCLYDVGEGVTRAGRFKFLKNRQLSRISNLESLVDLLRRGSDVEASTVLARLRLGDRVEDIVQPSQVDPISSTPKLSNSQSQTIANDASDSATKQDIANIAATNTADIFLSILFDMNDLRLDAKSHANVAQASTNITSSVSPMYCQPRDSDRHDTTLGSDFILAHAWEGERSKPPADHQACFSNLFCNLPTSSGILANHYAQAIQEQQLKCLSIPTWALKCINHDSGLNSVTAAITDIRKKLAKLLQEGQSWAALVGSHPHVAALLDARKFETAPLLSQWAASMVHSIKNKGDDFTCIASMYIFWYLARWMLSPSPVSYEAMPSWVRPTPYQVFVPHSPTLDFLVWPTLRDIAIQRTVMQENLEWLFHLSASIRCQWPHTVEEALCKDSTTGEVLLTEAAKAHFFDLANWSVGPSLRAYLPNADLYVSIRPHKD